MRKIPHIPMVVHPEPEQEATTKTDLVQLEVRLYELWRHVNLGVGLCLVNLIILSVLLVRSLSA